MNRGCFASSFAAVRRFLFVAASVAVLQGCASHPLRDADAQAASAAMVRRDITAGVFRMTIYSRIRDVNQPVTVYVEGDVRGWRPSTDPGVDDTPDDYLGLRLATLDAATNVVFIARPCQFPSGDTACFDPAWESGRLADQIYRSINRAIDHAVIVFPHPQIHMVGYSGGGAIAALLADRRRDVVSLRTVAGNLDPQGVERAHAANPNEDMIDPFDIAPRLAAMPQIHYVGDADDFVPPFVTENFVKAVGDAYGCVQVVHAPSATHLAGWDDVWARYSAVLPACAGGAARP